MEILIDRDEVFTRAYFEPSHYWVGLGLSPVINERCLAHVIKSAPC